MKLTGIHISHTLRDFREECSTLGDHTFTMHPDRHYFTMSASTIRRANTMDDIINGGPFLVVHVPSELNTVRIYVISRGDTVNKTIMLSNEAIHSKIPDTQWAALHGLITAAIYQLIHNPSTKTVNF